MTLQTLEVLSVLLAEPSPAHYGLEVSRAVGLPSGTIYPILSRLETAGWVVSDWEDLNPMDAGRPRRRLYRLTSEGSELASAELERARKSIASPSPIATTLPNSYRPPRLRPAGSPI